MTNPLRGRAGKTPPKIASRDWIWLNAFQLEQAQAGVGLTGGVSGRIQSMAQHYNLTRESLKTKLKHNF
jgi:hypothetical protein